MTSKTGNLRLTSIPEGLEGNRLVAFVGKLLCHILDKTDAPPDVERAQRTSRPRPATGEPPRPILIRLLRWSDKQEILTAARKKGRLTWEGHHFSIFQEFSAEIQRQRSSFVDIKKTLRRAGLQYGMIHPAKLRVTLGVGQQRIYSSPQEAVEDLKTKIPNCF